MKITLRGCWLVLKFCSTPLKNSVDLVFSQASFFFSERTQRVLTGMLMTSYEQSPLLLELGSVASKWSLGWWL